MLITNQSSFYFFPYVLSVSLSSNPRVSISSCFSFCFWSEFYPSSAFGTSSCVSSIVVDGSSAGLACSSAVSGSKIASMNISCGLFFLLRVELPPELGSCPKTKRSLPQLKRSLRFSFVNEARLSKFSGSLAN